MAATCKTDKKTMVVFRHPSDGKVSLFLEDLELRAAVISIKNLVYRLVRLASLLWKEKRGFVFFGEYTISSHNVRGRWLLFREG